MNWLAIVRRMSTVILPATPDCVPQVVASVAALFSEDGGQRDQHMDIQWPERDGTAYYIAAAKNPKYLCLVAREGAGRRSPAIGHLIGRITGHNELRPEAVQATLESMRVDPAHRQQGVGALLVAHFLQWADTERANEASVTAYAANETAIRFYRRCGFAPFELTLHRPLP